MVLDEPLSIFRYIVVRADNGISNISILERVKELNYYFKVISIILN